MITRMVINYKSKEPYGGETPAIFTTGSYTVTVGGRTFSFDFEDMEASVEFEGGFLLISVLQKNMDSNFFEDSDVTHAEADTLLRKITKEDFSEIYYECFVDSAEEIPVLLEPQDITFYDYSTSDDGSPIVAGGNSFSNLI